MYKKLSVLIVMIALLGAVQQVESKWWQRSKSEKSAKPGSASGAKQSKLSQIKERFTTRSRAEAPPQQPVIQETRQERRERAAQAGAEVRAREGSGQLGKKEEFIDPRSPAAATARVKRKYKGTLWE